LGAISDTRMSRRVFPSRFPRWPRHDGAPTTPSAGWAVFSSATRNCAMSLIQGNTAYQRRSRVARHSGLQLQPYECGRTGSSTSNPQKGTVRNDGFVDLQEASSITIYATSPSIYDFDSLRWEIQPFNVDFAAFSFQTISSDSPVCDRDSIPLAIQPCLVFASFFKDTNSG